MSRRLVPFQQLFAVLTIITLAAAAALVTAVPAGAQSSSKPVTIEHRFGETEIEGRPQSIVSLDPQWTDVLLAMGVTPVGHIRYSTMRDDFAWQDDKLADSTPIPYSTALEYEQIAALRPDLIVGTYSITDQSAYDRLDEIAPTVASVSDNEVDSWQDLTKVTGTILGQKAKAKKVTAKVQNKVDALAASMPGLQGKTIAFANYVPGTGLVVLGDPDDGANVLFADLGLEIAPSIRAEAKDATGRVTVSLERLDLLDGDVLAVLTNGANLNDVPGWSNLPAVKSGAVLDMDFESATALNTPSPLSVPWALRQLQPVLQKTAG